MAIGFASFEAYCADQNVTLHEAFAHDASAQFYTEEDLLTAIYWAGHHLRQAPRTPLADQRFSQDSEEVWPHDTAARTLHHLINASFRVEMPPEGRHNFPLAPSHINTCVSADRAFAKVIERLPLLPATPLVNPCIMHLDGDRPVILQKGGRDGVPSGLTLEGTWIDGVEYPAGSIIRVDYSGMDRELWRYPAGLTGGLYLRSVQDVSGAGFQRLSAFAFMLDERRPLFDHVHKAFPPSNKAGIEPLNNFLMEDIRRVARQAISAAGNC